MTIYLDDPKPKSGDPGDRFTVEIHTDNIYTVVSVSFGADIEVVDFRTIDAMLLVKIQIADTAPSGPRDIVVVNNIESATLSGGFTVK